VDDALDGACDLGWQRAEPRTEAFEQLRGELHAGLALEDATEMARVIVDAVEDQLLHAIAAELDERLERLRREDRVNDERDGAELLAQRADGRRRRFRRTELRIDDEDIDRLPADDAVGVGPIEGDVQAMLLADGAAEAGAAAGDAGLDVREAAREALPGWARDRASIEVRGGRVRIELRPPAPLTSIAERLSVTSVAWARPDRDSR
jgi:hypothetical protein